MKKIHNGYSILKDYHCFGCSPDNPIGLRLDFYEEGEYVISKWTPTHEYEGYHNVLHGGIQATLMDEIANWAIIRKLKQTGVTKSLTVNYSKSVYIHKGELTIRAKIVDTKKNEATVLAELLDAEGDVRSSAMVSYATFPDQVARNKFHFPGYENFFLEE